MKHFQPYCKYHHVLLNAQGCSLRAVFTLAALALPWEHSIRSSSSVTDICAWVNSTSHAYQWFSPQSMLQVFPFSQHHLCGAAFVNGTEAFWVKLTIETKALTYINNQLDIQYTKKEKKKKQGQSRLLLSGCWKIQRGALSIWKTLSLEVPPMYNFSNRW